MARRLPGLPNQRHASLVLGDMQATVKMDAHTLELLEFGKVRELFAGYAACSLGMELAHQVEPATDADGICAELVLVSEMVEALGLGQIPPFSGLHEVRLLAGRATIGAMPPAEQFLEVADTLL
jgi:DNA mismatch repair protein MutS2